MSQANPFLITAVKYSPKDQEVHAGELAVLRQKLLELKEALTRYTMTANDDADRDWGHSLRYRLEQFNVNLHDTNRLKVVKFMDDMELQDAGVYGTDVAQKATEFMQYWKEHALSGAQV